MKESLQIWTVYDNPTDYPGKFVARMFHYDQPTPEVMIAEDLRTLRRALERQGLFRMPRQAEDDPVIVESWL